MPIPKVEIYRHLFNGCVIRTRHNYSSYYEHCLYKDSCPIAQISVAQFRELSPILKYKKGSFTLNLNEVRKLSGHLLPKKLYKQNKLKTCKPLNNK
ncbi:hypothetical protein D6B99_11785 [Arachidicoccus soli]|uniref:Uncharacterized protein n=1 Tax=Arachidicoccus soli TaxID=2341117 RepID=A0A386HRE2_9BACT|nr:hypothetical protein D6B99_11785 [Arachidicoccus soli]